MKNLGLPYVAFWLGLFAFLGFWVYVASTHQDNSVDPVKQQCAKNNGILNQNGFGQWHCDIYITPKPSVK